MVRRPQPPLQPGLVQPPNYLSTVWILHRQNVSRDMKMIWDRCVILRFFKFLPNQLKYDQVTLNVRKYYDNVTRVEQNQFLKHVRLSLRIVTMLQENIENNKKNVSIIRIIRKMFL